MGGVTIARAAGRARRPASPIRRLFLFSSSFSSCLDLRTHFVARPGAPSSPRLARRVRSNPGAAGRRCGLDAGTPPPQTAVTSPFRFANVAMDSGSRAALVLANRHFRRTHRPGKTLQAVTPFLAPSLLLSAPPSSLSSTVRYSDGSAEARPRPGDKAGGRDVDKGDGQKGDACASLAPGPVRGQLGGRRRLLSRGKAQRQGDVASASTKSPPPSPLERNAPHAALLGAPRWRVDPRRHRPCPIQPHQSAPSRFPASLLGFHRTHLISLSSSVASHPPNYPQFLDFITPTPFPSAPRFRVHLLLRSLTAPAPRLLQPRALGATRGPFRAPSADPGRAGPWAPRRPGDWP